MRPQRLPMEKKQRGHTARSNRSRSQPLRARFAARSCQRAPAALPPNLAEPALCACLHSWEEHQRLLPRRRGSRHSALRRVRGLEQIQIIDPAARKLHPYFEWRTAQRARGSGARTDATPTPGLEEHHKESADQVRVTTAPYAAGSAGAWASHFRNSSLSC